MSKFIALRVLYLLDERSEKLAYRLANEAEKFGKCQFKLDVDHLPHITIYHAEYPVKNLSKIRSSLKNYSNKLHGSKLWSQGLESGWGYVGVNFKKTKDILKIHEDLVKELNLLREGHVREKYHEEIEKGIYSQSEAINIREFGYPYVLDLYRPHMNLVKFENESLGIKAMNKLIKEFRNFEGRIQGLALAEKGEFGSVSKLLDKCIFR